MDNTHSYDVARMTTPWIESPFFSELLQRRFDKQELTEHDAELCVQYRMFGAVTIDLGLSQQFVDELLADIHASLETIKKQEGGYHYNDSPRVFEAWKFSKNALALAKHPRILETLKMLYGRKAFPFQTINFLKGSKQPIHSDAIHFQTVPNRWVAGVWIALEQMDEFNGTLLYVPGSHKLPIYELHDLGIPVPAYGKQFESGAYPLYDSFAAQLLKVSGLLPKRFLGRRGHAIIWATNMLHGGDEVKDETRTRYSQAVHYIFEPVEHFYCPLFSEAHKGLYAEKDLAGKNILAHEIRPLSKP